MSRMIFRERRSRRQLQLNVTSLVDVLFLLLIFFMVTGTFKRMGEMELNLPDSTTSAPGTQPHAVDLGVRQGGAVTLNGEPVDPADLETRLKAIVEQDSESRVTLNADETVPHGQVVHLLDLVRDAGFRGVGFGTNLKERR